MPKLVVPLTDSKIRNTKPTPEKTQKLSDGAGLYLLIDKNGRKSWRFDYARPYSKKRNSIGFGHYPEVSLAEARKKREEVRSLLAKNIDPQVEKIRIETEIQNAIKNTFKTVALEWHDKQNLAASTIRGSKRLLEVIFQHIGHIPIHEIKPMDILNICRIYEREEKFETAKKVRVKCGQILRYAVSLGLCERDVTQDLRGVLQIQETKHMAALVNPNEFAQLLKDIDHYQGTIVTRLALKLAPLVFVRPGELRHAKWSDLDLDKAIWSYTPPKTKKKTGVEHIVPLSTQAIAIFMQLRDITQPYSEFIFPSMTSMLKPMSENTINQALRRLGYTNEQVCGHGFRASARTLLEEVLEFPAELIEQQLAHAVRDMHGRAYNRTKHLEKRRKMMQVWSNYCDELKNSADKS